MGTREVTAGRIRILEAGGKGRREETRACLHSQETTREEKNGLAARARREAGEESGKRLAARDVALLFQRRPRGRN